MTKQEQQDQLKQEAAKYVEEIKESIKQSDLMKECKKNITCKDCQHSYLRTSKNTTGDVYYAFECAKYGYMCDSLETMKAEVNEYVRLENQ